MQPQLPEHHHLAVVDPHVHERRRTRAVHHDGHAELSRELAGRREMVGVRVRVDEVANAQAVARGEREVVVDLADSGSISAAAQVSAQPMRYDWQPPVAICSKIIVPPFRSA